MGGGRTDCLFCPLVLRSNEKRWCGANDAARRQRRDGVAEAASVMMSSSKSECCSLHAFAAMGHERCRGSKATLNLA